MLYKNNYIEKLIGFKDIILNDVENNETSMIISIQLKVKPHNCPVCNSVTSKIHDYRNQIIKDISMFGKKVFINLRKRRYVCKHCKKRFYEKVSFVPRYHRMTLRLVKYIVKKMRSTHSMKSIAQECNLSVNTVSRVFKYINYTNTKLPKVLSIDEFKGNAGKRKYQCIITDPKNKKVLDILKGRE